MREFYDLKENDNTDLIIKLERDTVESCQDDLMGTLADVLSMADCYFVGDPFCLSNYLMGVYLVNYNAYKYYIVSYNDLYAMGDGEEITLHALDVDDEIKELMD